jgi:aspartate carbamoyltransferase catalytic subunit
VACYADAIVLRHFEIGAAQKASEVSPVPIINAGDGAGQHPTQALLDLYTIYNELGRIDGLHVGLSGDLANGRTARSLCYLLSKFKDIKLTFIAPSVVQMRDDIKKHLENVGVEFFEIEDLQEVASEVDVLYQTRIQKERFGDRLDKYEQACARQSVDVSILNRMKSHSIVLHPLPRNNEIAPEVDQDPRAAYFRQVKNGLFVRMALLEYVLT